MRISDWSSDVCSSDLRRADREGRVGGGGAPLLVGLSAHHEVDRAALRQRTMGEIGLGQRLAADRHRLKIDVRVAVVLRVDRQRLAIGHGQFRLLRSEEHTSELQSLMRISYAVFCLKKKNKTK